MLEKIQEKLNDEQLQELAFELMDLTDYNNHIEARQLIAKEFKMGKYEKIFKALSDIRDADNGISPLLSEYQYEVTNEMLNIIKNLYGEDIYNMIYGSL